MSKITYEEESINIWDHKFTKEEFDNLVAGFKPPTFDEVVKVWGDIGYKVNFINQINEIDVIKNEYTIEIYEDMFYGYRMTLTGEKDPFSINEVELNAINLTIRYLEAKEKENESL